MAVDPAFLFLVLDLMGVFPRRGSGEPGRAAGIRRPTLLAALLSDCFFFSNLIFWRFESTGLQKEKYTSEE